MTEYPLTIEKDGHARLFQAQWLNTYNWLEYCPTIFAAYYFPRFLFGWKTLGKSSSYAFTNNYLS